MFGGLINLPFVAPLEAWLEPIVALGPVGVPEHPSTALEIVLLVVSGLVAIVGIYLAYRMYVRQSGWNDLLRERLSGFYKLAANGYYFDAAYDEIRKGLWVTARFFADTVDLRGIDGAVNGVARSVGWVGERTRRLQTGLVGTYALTLFVGLVIVLGYFLITAMVK